MTINKFPVGTKVAVYDNGNRKVGVVERPLYPGTHITVRFDVTCTLNVLPQQCRRLVPKKKGRELWVEHAKMGDDDCWYSRVSTVEQNHPWVRVREVL